MKLIIRKPKLTKQGKKHLIEMLIIGIVLSAIWAYIFPSGMNPFVTGAIFLLGFMTVPTISAFTSKKFK